MVLINERNKFHNDGKWSENKYHIRYMFHLPKSSLPLWEAHSIRNPQLGQMIKYLLVHVQCTNKFSLYASTIYKLEFIVFCDFNLNEIWWADMFFNYRYITVCKQLNFQGCNFRVYPWDANSWFQSHWMDVSFLQNSIFTCLGSVE